MLHIAAFSNTQEGSLRMHSCWMSWITTMMRHDVSQAYALHSFVIPMGMHNDTRPLALTHVALVRVCHVCIWWLVRSLRR